MTTPTRTRTRSQIGRASRNKGIAFERAVARALRPWWPQAHRSRDNGSAVTADTGDLADAGPAWWSLKDVAAARTEPPALVASWLAEAREKAGALVVVKRAGYADPLDAWCWLALDDLCALRDGADPHRGPIVPVRMRLGDVRQLLCAAGYAGGPVS